jgi:hypothetical protein
MSFNYNSQLKPSIFKSSIKEKIGLDEIPRLMTTMNYVNKQGSMMAGPGVPMRLTLKNEEVDEAEQFDPNVVP